MKHRPTSISHIFFVLVNLLTCGLLLILSRNFLQLGLPLFEEIILAAVLSSILCLISGFYIARVKALIGSVRMIAYLAFIGLLIATIVFPYSLVNIDRSRSFFVLSWVDLGKISDKSGEITLSVISHESVDKAGVLQRLNEQQQRGLVSKKDNSFELTDYGKFMLQIANFLAKLFNLENWEANKI